MRIIGNNPDADNAEITAVASGTLPDGKPVVVNADGTVSVVAGVDQAFGSAVVFNAGTIYQPALKGAFDSSNNKVVIAYKDSGNSSYGTAIVGTVSGTSISFGSEVIFEAAAIDYPAITFDSSNNKVVIAYEDVGNSEYGTAIVGTVSGTSITFGSAVVFNAGRVEEVVITFDSSNNKVVIAYQDRVNNSKGTGIVGTVSGTSISFGNEVALSNPVNFMSATFDSSNNKVVISYRHSTTDKGYAVVGTVSGTSISFGTEVIFENAATSNNIDSTFDSSNNKVVIVYTDAGNSNYGTAIVGTVSGTSISFGTAVVFEAASAFQTIVTFDSNANKVFVAYRDQDNSNYSTAIVGTVSGTSISFGSPTVFEAATSYPSSAIFDSFNNKVVIGYRDGGNSNYGTSIVFQNESTNLTSENFIGFSDAAYADTQTATIEVGSAINNGQSSLTIGQQYFVQTDGTIGTTAADPSVIAGTAISATEIIVKG